MRRILVDKARKKQILKHGSHQQRVDLFDDQVMTQPSDERLLALDEPPRSGLRTNNLGWRRPQQEAVMKSVDLIEASVDELGGVVPTAGAEVVLGGVRYQVLHVIPPRERSSRRGVKRAGDLQARWKLLVQTTPPPPGEGS
jgi:hypothetical protein